MSKKKKEAAANHGRYEVSDGHDSFFQEMMGEPKVYRQLIKERLPKKILRHLDLRTVKPTKTHFIDERLRHLYSDCLYTVRTRDGHTVNICTGRAPEPIRLLDPISRMAIYLWRLGRRQAPGKGQAGETAPGDPIGSL